MPYFESDLRLRVIRADTLSSQVLLPAIPSNSNDNGILHGGAILALAIKSSQLVIAKMKENNPGELVSGFELSQISSHFYSLTKGENVRSHSTLKRRSNNFLFFSCSVESEISQQVIASLDLIFTVSPDRDALTPIHLAATPLSPDHIFKEKFNLHLTQRQSLQSSHFHLKPDGYFLTPEGLFDPAALLAVADTCIMKHFWDLIPESEKINYFGCTVSLTFQSISSAHVPHHFEIFTTPLENKNYSVRLTMSDNSKQSVAECQCLYRFYKRAPAPL